MVIWHATGVSRLTCSELTDPCLINTYVQQANTLHMRLAVFGCHEDADDMNVKCRLYMAMHSYA